VTQVRNASEPPLPATESLSNAFPSKFPFGAAVFLSAFLLFEIQPIIAKMILPWFGGSAAVWSVCLLFFQAALLLGYLYAHVLVRFSRSPVCRWVHVTLLAAAIAALPVLPQNSWRPLGSEDPALRILLLLLVTIGLPYFLLSATSPLLQAWYARTRQGGAPYRFYALSNGGSLLALLSYPVLIEPFLSRSHQAWGWSAAFVFFALLCGALALIFLAPSREDAHSRPVASPRPPWTTQLLWVALSACGSMLLLAVTNHISQNIAAVPFLWILPLSLYLLSLILCFEGHGWYHRGFFLRFLGVALGGMAYAVSPLFANMPLVPLIALFCGGLFVCCMFCHGELARLKPPAGHLTLFYLLFSLGGALGAVFVALLAPRIFSGFYELHVGLVLCAALVLVVLRSDPGSALYKARWQPDWLIVVGLACALTASLIFTTHESASNARFRARNFYGALRVVDTSVAAESGGNPASSGPEARVRELFNGTIKHGVQFLEPARRREPTSYYAPDSGVGLALRTLGAKGPLRVGVIGLGAGTLAAYGRAGDHYTFYEINPLVVQIANQQFTFLRDSPAQIDIELGDARLSLERELPQNFDVLAVDAFSGDSIPVHLLTREAFALYFRTLKPDGVLSVHISSRYLNLQPVVDAVASSFGKQSTLIVNDKDDEAGVSIASWMNVGGPIDLVGANSATSGKAPAKFLARYLWTDDYSSLFRILK
jgi:SAM-dependent methyltransferase